MNNYEPPFFITNVMLTLVASIMEKIGTLDDYSNLEKMPILRKNNRIQSIHSSLAIEDNSLSFKEVKDVIDGKLVIGPDREIQEVKNAYNSYLMINKVDPYNTFDLLQVHGVMTYNIINDSGKFRKAGEGVFDGDKCIFVAPPAHSVPSLIKDLLLWSKVNKNIIHPLILSSVFHYEFLFIHPFSDGNGRISRLWQNILLTNYKGIFEYLPIESRIKKYQKEYYKVIDESNKCGDANSFIEFMLRMIDEVLNELVNNTKVSKNNFNRYIFDLLDIMDYDIPLSSLEIMNRLHIKSKETLRSKYLNPAVKEGLIRLTLPDKPTSKNQMYYKV